MKLRSFILYLIPISVNQRHDALDVNLDSIQYLKFKLLSNIKLVKSAFCKSFSPKYLYFCFHDYIFLSK